MSVAEINGVKINYYLDGEGEETVVILNGIMMSTASWEDFVPVYTAREKLQLLRMDFRDQGESSKYEEEYDLSLHVEDLQGLFTHLNLGKVNIVGISYGAMVATLFALEYPQMVSTLILANTVGRVTNYLKSAGDLWQEAAKLNDGKKFFRIAMPLIYSDKFYNQNIDWLREREGVLADHLTAEWFESFRRLERSGRNFDVMDRLGEIKIPTLLIGSERDRLTPIPELKKMHRKLPNSQMIIIEGAGHASCYEKMNEFNLAVLGFIALQQGL